MSLVKWDSASATTHFYVLGDFAFSFLQNCTVKLIKTMPVRVTLNKYQLKE